MRIAQVLPRHSKFDEKHANSIDLTIRDFVLFSKYRDTSFFIGPEVGSHYGDINYLPTKYNRFGRHYSTADFGRLIAANKIDIVVVQQHIPTAVSLAAAFPKVPFVLHRHNFEKKPRSLLSGLLRRRRYAMVGGIIVVSDALIQTVAAEWPGILSKTVTVHNGLDFSQWRPAAERRPEILWVGRAVPEKGCIEAARAVIRVLERTEGWTGRFILSGTTEKPDYFDEVMRTLAPVGERIRVDLNQPFPAVKEAAENAAIALCPSIWQEPFGRTALEAHAGGAALVSSGRGGLREISGAHAIYLDEVTAPSIEAAVQRLIEDPGRRADLQQRGHAHARAHFDIRIVAGQYDAALERFFEAASRKPTAGSPGPA